MSFSNDFNDILFGLFEDTIDFVHCTVIGNGVSNSDRETIEYKPVVDDTLGAVKEPFAYIRTVFVHNDMDDTASTRTNSFLAQDTSQ